MTRIFYECHIGVFSLELIVLRGEIEQVVMSQPHPEFLEVVSEVEILYELAKASGCAQIADNGSTLSGGGGFNGIASVNRADSNLDGGKVHSSES